MRKCTTNTTHEIEKLIQKTTKSGRLIIISAASGTGKTALIKELCKLEPQLQVSISYTTRQKRTNEVDGTDYFFANTDAFQQMVQDKKFLEHANVFGNYYGTSKDWVESQLSAGSFILLEIDWQGAIQISQLIPDCIQIFILPPSYKALHDRLLARGQDDMATIQRRLRLAKEDISHCHAYDFLMINDQFDLALAELQGMISALKEGKVIQQADLGEFVQNLMADPQH